MKPQSKIDVLISRAKTITDADPTTKSLNTLGSALFVVCVVLGIAALIFGIGFFAVSVVDTLKPEQTSIIVLISCVVGAVLLIVFGYILKLVIKGFAYVVQYNSETAIAARLQAEASIYELKKQELKEQRAAEETSGPEAF